MKNLLLLVMISVSVLSVAASSKTITVLGDQKVKTRWDGDMPKAMKDGGIETDVTGIIISGRKLIPTFGFAYSAKKKVVKVVVEDVTGKAAISMVEDTVPVIAHERWKGDSSPRSITPEEVPWLFAPGDSMTVFRFTVFFELEAKPVVIFQPSVFREASKIQLRNLVGAKNR